MVRITPDEFMDTDKARAILRTKARALNEAIGVHFFTGNNLYTLTQMEEDMEFETNLRGTPATIKIEVGRGNVIQLDEHFTNEDSTLSQMIINCVVKEAFRETDLK